MKNLKLGNVILAVALLLSAVLSANVSALPFCGDTLFANTTLTGDPQCPFAGLRIGADNVTLDCDNHTIEAAGGRVVEVNFGLDSVTVRNCVLIGTANTDALRLNGGTTNILITDNQITTSGQVGRGIRTLGTSFSTISNNTITTSGLRSSGLRLQNSPDNLLENNTIVTSAIFSRGFRLQSGSNDNHIIGNLVHTTGEVASSGVLLRAGSNGNTVKRNVLRTDNSPPVKIDSSSDNVFHENTLVSATDWLLIRRFALQNGGLSVHPDGRIFVVENNFGSGFGVGTATAFMEIDPATGAAIDVTRLTMGGIDLGFGFDALEITPDPVPRFLALRGGGANADELFEINPDTGVVTFLFAVNGFGGVNGLESNGIGSLLATTNSGDLVSINLVSGVSTSIGADGNGWTDLAIDTGTAYALSRHTTEASQSNHLFEINTTTGGIVQEIGDTGFAFVSDMDFAPDGTLYANDASLSLLVINPVSAATESVGTFGEDPFEPPSENNSLRKTTLVAVGGSGSVHYPGTLAVPSGELVDVSTAELDISFNRVFVDSTTYPFLDQKAIITLLGLPGKKRRLLVDEDDDGEFERCRGRQCKLRLFSGGTLVFKVNGFTTYSSEERTKKKDDDDDDDDD